jgi:hypothetical protein
LYFVKKYFFSSFSSQILPQNHRSMQITKDIKYKVSSKKENCVWMWNNVMLRKTNKENIFSYLSSKLRSAEDETDFSSKKIKIWGTSIFIWIFKDLKFNIWTVFCRDEIYGCKKDKYICIVFLHLKNDKTDEEEL